MKIANWLVLGLFALPMAELIAFVLVASTLGWSTALVLLIATSGAGALFLYRNIPGWLHNLREVLSGRRAPTAAARDVPLVPALVGILLAVPGFLTDIAALLVLLPVVRERINAVLGTREPVVGPGAGRRPPGSDPVVDLTPDEWQHVSDDPPGRRRRDRG